MSPRIRSQSTLTVGPASQTLCLPTTIPRPLQVTLNQTGLWTSLWQLLDQSLDRVQPTHPLDSAPIPFTIMRYDTSSDSPAQSANRPHLVRPCFPRQ